MLSEAPFTKENLDHYLKELAKEFRKRNGKTVPAEIVLIGGASVVINYGFREMTNGMDAIISATSSMKEAINNVGDRFGLPNGWMNSDFMNTISYTPKIIQFSEFYKVFSNIITVRTVTGEYLIAMKLMSGRQYKYDLSDVVGILWEQERKGQPLTLEQIQKAIVDLYDSYDRLPLESRSFIERTLADGKYEAMYGYIRKMEAENKKILIEYQEEKPGVINNDNTSSIIAAIRKIQGKQ